MLTNKIIKIGAIFLSLLVAMAPACEAKDFYIKNNTQTFLYVNGTSGNIGMGTTTPQSGLAITNGNVGIGTWAAGRALDVNGTVRMTGFALTTTPTSGYVLTADGNGNGAWAAAGGSQWITNTGVGIGTYGNVGIGTTTAQGSLVITNGNVGIGTWSPNGGSLIVASGNVGIGSLAPGQMLDVQGTVRSTYLAMTGGAPSSGFVLTATDSNGDSTWSSTGSSSGWNVSGTNIYNANSGNVGINTTNGANVGIGTSTPQGALVVTNGNVGIGTWAPITALQIGNNQNTAKGLFINSSGNVGIGTWAISDAALHVYGNSVLGASESAGSSQGTVIASGSNTLAGGHSGYGGQATSITSSGSGSIAFGDAFGGAQPASITSSSYGSFAEGYSWGLGSSPSIIEAQNDGSVAMGYAYGIINSNGNGSIAMGYSASGETISALGNGSVAMGENVQANANNSFALGKSMVNPTASSFMVGYSAIPALTVTNSTVGVGIGTYTTPSGALVVQGGNVGIGTFNPFGGGLVVLPASTGNVGIGSLTPGQALDVQGTVRSTYLAMTGGAPSSGFVLTATDSNGDSTWSSTGSSSGWNVSGTNIYNANTGNVGINTTNGANVGIGTSTPQGALVVTNGNVGIGTWVPASNPLSVIGSVSIGSAAYNNLVAPVNGLAVSGNVGIGTWTATLPLSIVATYGAVQLTSTQTNANTFSMQGPSHPQMALYDNASSIGNGANLIFQVKNGHPLAANLAEIGNIADSVGDGTASGDLFFATANSSQTLVEQMRITSGGNVGIGSTAPGGKLDVEGTVNPVVFMAASGSNQNVGIGSFNPGQLLDVHGTVRALGGIVNGNVGIGSAWPGQALDVNGTVRMTGFAMTTSPTSGYVLTSDNNGNGTWAAAAASSQWITNAGVGIGTYGNVGIGTTTPQGALVVTNGNVGIGTWAPAGKLEIEGGNVGINTFNTVRGALTVMGGNVGIGTWDPVALFQVGAGGASTANNFNVSSTGAVTAMGITLTNGSSISGNSGNGSMSVVGGPNNNSTLTIESSSASGTADTMIFKTGSQSERMRIDTTGNIGIGTFNTANPVAKLAVAGNIGIGTNASSAYVAVQSPTPGGMIVEGNVGIGSLTPGQKLDVQGTVRSTYLAMTGGAPSSGFVLTATDSNGDTTWSSTGSSSGWNISGTNIYNANTGNVGINTTNGANVGIGTSTPQGALVVTNGNVGIGTWAPTSALSVVGSGNNYLAMNVGIGSVNPAAALDVTGSVRMTGFALTASPSSGYVLTSDGSGNGTWQTVAGTISGLTPSYITKASSGTAITNSLLYDTGTNIGLGTTTPQGAFVVTNGNVGIGTWTATSPLSVSGNVTISNGNLFLSTNTDAYQLAGGGGGVRTVLAMDSNTNLDFGDSGTGNLIMQNGGNVGIGTTTPQGGFVVTKGNVGIGTWAPARALDVTGTVRMTGFAMTTSPTSGYVLTSDNNGNGTWAAAAGSSQWITNAGVGIGTYSNVGIGTITPQGSLVVTNGNVGIGTWVPGGSLIVQGGSVGIGTNSPSALFDVNGSSILGTTSDSLEYLISNGTGSLAGGYAQQGLGAGASIKSSGMGSLAFGGALNSAGGASFIYSTGAGSIAMGAAEVNGTLQSTGVGAITLGFAHSGTLQATGTASVVIGENVQATADNAFALGLNMVNPTASSFMVGFSATPALTVTNTTVGVGIGTYTMPSGALVVQGGNVGIGTFNPFGGGLIVLPSQTGNVGIGSLTPGQVLDVQGTVRMTGFAMTTSPTSGYVLTSDNNGNGTWAAAAGSSQWITNAGVGIGTYSNVGIGTTTPQGAFVVTNGNVGIGTWAPNSPLVVTKAAIGTSSSYVNDYSAPSNGLMVQGNVGIGTWTSGYKLTVATAGGTDGLEITGSSHWFQLSPSLGAGNDNPIVQSNDNGFIFSSGSQGNGNLVIAPWSSSLSGLRMNSNGNIGLGTSSTQAMFAVVGGNVGIGTWTAAGGNLIVNGGGNVGIGSAWPGQALDVQGTVRSTYLAMTGGAPSSGFVLTATDSSGDTTWSSTGSSSGWNIAGTNIYNANSGNVGINTTNGANVGIGTSTPQGALVVTNGNVGIGTWAPTGALSVVGTGSNYFGSNVGINNVSPGQALDVTGTVRMTGFALTSSPSSGYVLTSDASGTGTWQTVSGTVSGLTAGTIPQAASGTSLSNSVMVQANNNIGIGTSTPQGSFVVTNGNVGIGTWAPLAALDIESGDSNGAINIPYADTSGSTDFGWIVAGHDSYNLLGMGADKTVMLNAPSSGGSFKFVTGGAESNAMVTITSGGNVGIGTSTPQGSFVVTNGNIGIGTWAPIAALDMGPSGGIRLGGVTQTSWPAGGSNYWLQNTGVGIGTYANVGIGTTTAQGGLVVTNGNVGIGTWVPTSNLDVEGKAFFTEFGTGKGITLDGASTGEYIDFGNGVGSASDGQMGVYGSSFTFNTPTGFTFQFSGTTKVSMDSNGNVGIGTNILSNSALAVMNGNVGIGTWAPAGTLDVEGAVSTAIFKGNVGIGTSTPGTALSVLGGVGIGQAAVVPVASGNMLISGNVGIGTTSLGQAGYGSEHGLEINGGLLLDGGSAYGINYYGVNNTNYFVAPYVSAGGISAALSGNVGIGTWTPQGALVVTNGNIGIGTWAPIAALDLGPSGGIRLGGVTNTSWPSAGSNYWLQNTGVGIGTYANVGIGTTTAQGGLVVTNGNVGIGTWTATNNLFNVAGGVGIGTSYVANYASTANGMIIQGNLGIGTWAPNSSLNIIGSFGVATVAKSSNYVATANDHVILVSGNTTITLPASANSKGRIYQIKKTDSSATTMTIQGNASELIDGANTLTTTTQYQSYTLVCDGTQWWVI